MYMGALDLPQITSSDIGMELNKPQSQEVLSVGECVKDIDELLADSKREVQKLQGEIKNNEPKLKQEYSENEKTSLRNIYCQLPPKPKGEELNPEEPVEVLRKAIETQTIQIFEVPGRDLVALSIEGKNVDYFFNKNGEEYVNVKDFREGVFGNNISDTLNKLHGALEIKENGVYSIYIGEEKLPMFSDRYLNVLVSFFDTTFDMVNALKEAYNISDEDLK